jgi:GntR family transcriptional repressor for pyruvate dehydrogenase complex
MSPAHPVPKPTAAPGRPPGVRRATLDRAGRRGMKTSEFVALQIIRNIVERDLQPGDKLPLESAMLHDYRVSRSSLREALRLLEVQELISIRPGPGGGAVVGKAQSVAFGRTLTLHMHMIGATYDELLDTWMLTEGQLAELAAQNPDRARVERMLKPFLAPEDASADCVHEIAEGLRFHDIVGELANNRVLSFLLLTAGSVVAEHIMTTVDRKALEDHIVHDHAAIAKAIIAGNAKKARQLMTEHVQHVVQHFRDYWPRTVGGKIQWR